MHRYPPAARVWLIGTVLAAVALTFAGPGPKFAALAPWVTLAFLALCAAVAHFFPIKSSADGATYQLTNVFLVAGAALLPPAHLALLVIFALSPQAWRTRHRPGVLIRWSFNVGQATVAAQLAHRWVELVENDQFGELFTVLALVGAAVVFTLVQNTILGVMTSLFFQKPLRQAEALSRAALLGDGFAGLLGAVVAGQWLTHPFLVTLLLPLLVVAHRMTQSAHLAQLAQVDVKTGLHNARHFELALAEELQRSQRLRQPLTLLFADLDHFKRVNDTHGHAAGDKVLEEMAELLRSSLRQGDMVARFGGEEFVALLRETGSEEGLYLAERLRASVANHPFPLPDGKILRCTVSVGLATAPEDGTTVESLLEQADIAMYRAKQTRDATVRAGALPTVPRLEQAPAEAPAAPPAPGAGEPSPAPARQRHLDVAFAQWGTILAGIAAVVVSVVGVTAGGLWGALLPYLVCGLVAEALTVQILETNRQRLTFSFTIAVALAAAVAVPFGAPLVSLAAALFHAARASRRQPWGKLLFNLANPALAAAGAAACFAVLGVDQAMITRQALVAACVAVAAFYLINMGLVALMISLHSRRRFHQVLAESLWSAPTNLLLGVTGAFLGLSYAQIGILGTLVFGAPLLVMRFTLAYYARQSQAAIATLQAANAEVEQAHREKEQTLGQLIKTVAAIIDARDQAVAGHSDRVATYAVALGRELGLTPKELAYLHTAGLLHDLGKVAVPEAILHKPAKLTAAEFAIVKEHAATGERILAEVRPLAEVARMVGDHHERYDGDGYPNREGGVAITLGGRIVAVADTLDSILSDRPYSKGKPLAWALEEFDRCAGTHFDPDVVAALHRAVEDLTPEFFTSATYDVTGMEPFAPSTGVVIPFPQDRREGKGERPTMLPAL